ncbi:MAG TPA: sigma-70 family RNA polymerase sigma factor [Salinivirgaceae bacterium]|nr:sigma-70 family RNA polymerase sigma factor [Salinivirgaceae bacterium]
MTAVEFNTQLLGLRKSLWRFAYSLTLNKFEADDLLQETMLRAIRFRDMFIDDTNLQSWTFTILRNTFINEYRKKNRLSQKYDNSKDLSSFKIPVISHWGHPESSLLAKEIQKAIALLPDDYRIPFVMHTEGYLYKEIAEVMNLPLGSVKSRIFIARRRLMAMLKDYR